jgi:acyl carrier protein
MRLLQDLERFVLTEIAADFGKKSLDPDEDLLEQGIIDSMGVMALITFMEETFNIEIIEEDIVPENFQSLNAMANFIEQKTRDSSSPILSEVP